MKPVKKILKVFLIVLLSVVLLNILLFIAFTFPSVQKYAADTAIRKLKPKLNTELSIDKIRIKFFNSVEFGGVYVEDLQQDTLVYLEQFSAGINIRGLLRNKLSISSVKLSGFTANVKRDSLDGDFNFQFIIDAFGPKDTVPKPEKKPMDISISNIKITNGVLHYDILSEPYTPGRFNTNHFSVNDFNLIANVPSLDMEKLRAEIISLKLEEENAGIGIKKLNGKFKSSGSKLTADKLNLIFNNSELEVKSASYDTASKEFDALLKSDMTDPADISVFTEMLSHLNKPITLDAALNGKIPQAEISNFKLNYGNDTKVVLTGSISDFTNMDDADVDISVSQLKTTERDLESFIRIGPKDFENVPQMVALKQFDLDLRAKGKLSNFKVIAHIKTAPGKITFDGTGSMKNQFSDLVFKGKVKSENLHVAQIIGESTGVDNLSLNVKAGAEIKKDKPVKAYADGVIGSVNYKDFVYQNLHLDGVYSGSNVHAVVKSNTDENKFDLTADIGFGEQMKLNADAVIDKLYLSPLMEIKQWDNPYLTTRITADLEGAGVDNLAGLVVIDSTSLYDDNFIYNPGPIYLQALTADDSGMKKIEVFSSILEGEILGEYHFTTIGSEISAALSHHLPSLIQKPEPATTGEPNQFKFNFLLKNTEDLSYALTLPFINVDNATINGNVDMKEHNDITIEGHIPRLMMGQNDIRESRLTLDLKSSTGLNLNADTYLVQDNGHINAKLTTSAIDDYVSNNLAFVVDNKVAKADGSLNVSMDFLKDDNDDLISHIDINPTKILFNGKTIDVLPTEILYEKERISIDNFELKEEQMLLLGIDGVASKVREDSIRVFFNNTDLNTILASFNFTGVYGSINGGLVVHQALSEPVVHTDNFRIENIYTQKDTLGSLIIDGNWDNINNGLVLDADLIKKGENYLCVEGFVPLGGDENIDLNLDITKLPLRWVQPFAVSTFSDLSGTVDSKINISGKLSEPQTSGWMGVNEGIMTVAFTNVTYKISDTINISPDRIGLDNLIITDNNNHEAKLTLSLQHSNFDGMNYNVNLRLNDFLLLNNEKRVDELAYGTLKLSGDVNLTGSASGIFGTANLKNESRSKVMIELPQTAQATEYSGIIYINTPQKLDTLSFLRANRDSDSRMNTRLASGIPINIQANLDINSQLEAGVEINPTTGDALEIRGRGQIRATIDSKSEPMVRLYGDYIAEGGKFHYNFENLKSIDFNLKSGSTVTLIGDPMSTQFNITAYNQVNADLATLSESFANEVSKSRIPVNAVLEIQGSLDQMSLNYGIELPDASNDIRQRLNSMISTDEQKNKQFASLILAGGFMPEEGSGDAGLSRSTMATSLAIGQLAKGLDAIFASAFDDNWSINTNIQSSDGTFENIRMGVDVSTRLFNDKMRLTTNLSYGENSTLASQQAFMGEFELEYDINSWLMMRAYNRSNQRFSKRAPTTQGAGVVVTKDSQKFRDLFKFSFRKRDED